MTTTIETQLGPGPDAGQAGQPWRALLALVGVPTSDGRIFDALTWRTLPLSLLWQPENDPGHEGAVIVGRIDSITRDGPNVWGSGVIDTMGPDGREVTRLIRERFLRGISIDAAVLDVTEADDGLMHFSGEIGAATVVAFPAFAEAEIELVDSEPLAQREQNANSPYATGGWVYNPNANGTASSTVTLQAGEQLLTGEQLRALAETYADVRMEPHPAPLAPHEPSFFGPGLSLTAAARPGDSPNAEWFAPPRLDRRMGLHVEADGRIWGHIYGWGECHTGSPHRCVQVPRGGSYDYITGIDGRGVLCSDGTLVSTGPIAIAADHADLHLSWLAAKDHYANTALAVGDVTCGEDDHGIWVAGMVRPGTPDELVHALRASGPSGDWRRVGGRLNLVAILAVNTQGYPALAALFADGEAISLVASGGTTSEACGCGSSELAARIATLEAEMERLTGPERAEALAALEAAIGLDLPTRLAMLDVAFATEGVTP